MIILTDSTLRADITWHIESNELEGALGFSKLDTEDRIIPPITTVYAVYSVKVTNPKGEPVPGIPFSATVQSQNLNEMSWRDKETLLSRFPKSSAEKLSRYLHSRLDGR